MGCRQDQVSSYRTILHRELGASVKFMREHRVQKGNYVLFMNNDRTSGGVSERLLTLSLKTCMYACTIHVYRYMYLCIDLYIICTKIHTYSHARMHACTHAHTHSHTNTHVHIICKLQMNSHIHIHTHTQ